MAGRCISVTHEALGTTRVMKTCGMMGEVVGKAASICTLNQCTPRQVYEDHLSDLLNLVQLPGKARRSTPSGEIVIPSDALPLAGPMGPPTGKELGKLKGIVVDDDQAVLKGTWTVGTGLPNYVQYGYRYGSPNSNSSASYALTAKAAGEYAVEIFTQSHQNRSTKTPVTVVQSGQERTFYVNQREANPEGVARVVNINLAQGETVTVQIRTRGADGTVHVDAVRLLELP